MKSSLKVASRLYAWLYKNLANCITITRYICTAWFMILAIWHPELVMLMCVLVILSALTDLLDGYVARKMKIISLVGGFLDRLADKLFICTLVIFIAWGHWRGAEIGQWLKTFTQSVICLIVGFEALLMAGGLVSSWRGKHISANQFGKKKMFVQSAAVILWFIFWAASQQWPISMRWPLIITNFLFIWSIYLALKSVHGYADEFLAARQGG